MLGRVSVLRRALRATSTLSSEVLPCVGLRCSTVFGHSRRISRFASSQQTKLDSSPLVTDPDVNLAYARERPEHYSKISLQIRSWDHAILDSFVGFLQRSSDAMSIEASGRIALPTHMRKWTLLKSPHIFKKHRVQYEMRTHKRVIEIHNMSRATADTYLEYIQDCLPEGVSMKLTKYSKEPILPRSNAAEEET